MIHPQSYKKIDQLPATLPDALPPPRTGNFVEICKSMQIDTIGEVLAG